MYKWAPVWFGVEESSDYIGFVYQFGVKGMRARKHVQYHILGWMEASMHRLRAPV